MRNTLNRFGIGIICLLALAGQQTARADDAKPDAAKPVTLTQSLKAKDTVQYKVVMTISAGGADIVVEQSSKHMVKEIKDNGNVVLSLTPLGGKVNFNGSDQDIPPGSPFTMTRSKNGKVLTYDAEDTPYLTTATQHILAMVDSILFPEKPVKPGDSWTTEVDNPAVKGKKVKIKTTYVSADKADGVAVWKVKQTLEADTEDGGKLTSETTALLDVANGQLIQADNDVKGIPGKMGMVDWKSKLQRVKPDAVKADK